MAMLTLISASDLKSSEQLAVAIDSSGLCELETAATVGNQVIGLLVDGGSASGDAVSVASTGEVAWGKASTSITAGAYVAATTAGKLVTTTTNKHEYIGRALTSAGATNDLIQVMVSLGTISS